MITVYFVQHGLAESKEIDETRPLSGSGIEEVRTVAGKLRDHDIEIAKIYHSGKLRAVQTASIFAELLDTAEVSALSGMNPNDDPQALIEQVTEDAAMYVGHLPNMQTVVSNILSDGKNSSIVKFQNSAVACIETQHDQSSLKWFITPEMC